MLRKPISLVSAVLMMTVMAMAQNPHREYIDLRPELKNKKFADGKHLIKTLSDGTKLSLGFKAGKVVEVYLTNKTGKEHKAVLAELKPSHDPLPPEAQRDARWALRNPDGSLQDHDPSHNCYLYADFSGEDGCGINMCVKDVDFGYGILSDDQGNPCYLIVKVVNCC